MRRKDKKRERERGRRCGVVSRSSGVSSPLSLHWKKEPAATVALSLRRSAFTRNVYASFEIRSSGRATFWASAERGREREQSRRRSHRLGRDRAGPNCSEINPRDHFGNFAALSFHPHLCSDVASLKSFRPSLPPAQSFQPHYLLRAI